MMLIPIKPDGPGRVKIEPTGEKCAGCSRPFTNVSEYRYIEGDPAGRKWCRPCAEKPEAGLDP